MTTQSMFPTLDRAAVMTLLSDEAMHLVGRRRPDDSEPPAAHAAFAKTVKRSISSVSQTIHRAGLHELRKYYRHPAFRHDRALREWIAKAYAACKKSGDRRALVYCVLLLRDQVRHYYEFSGVKQTDDRFPLPSARDPERPIKRVWRKNDEGEYEDYLVKGDEVKLVDGNKTAFLDAFDTMGWDRPSSFPTKSTRMAFCGTCAKHGRTPWWRVRRRTTKDGYEQAPFQLREICPNTWVDDRGTVQPCGQVETRPEPATSTRVFFHRRLVRRHGVKVFQYTLFYRAHGRWAWASDHSLCHAELHHALEQRWRMQRPLKIAPK